MISDTLEYLSDIIIIFPVIIHFYNIMQKLCFIHKPHIYDFKSLDDSIFSVITGFSYINSPKVVG